MSTVIGGAPVTAFSADSGPLFQKLAESVRDGRCILFLGAGVHHGPEEGSPYVYPDAERPPLGGELAQSMALECDFANKCPGEADTDLKRVALCYQTVFDRQSLVSELKKAVEDGTKPSQALRALGELPFRLVMTTNYDTLFERALRRIDKDPVIEIYNPERYARTADFPSDRDLSAQTPFVFKAHGDVSKPASIVVTDEDYITFVLRMNAEEQASPIPETFRYHLNRWPTLFLGYRLLDFDLRLLFRTLRWKLDEAQRPSSYSVDCRPDPLVREEWTRTHGLHFIVEDVWKFVPRLYEEVLGRPLEPTPRGP